MKPFKHSMGFAALACAVALSGTPGLSSAMEEGFYMGLSASAENLDSTVSKTTDNTHPMNVTASSGRTFHVRDSDDKTTSGFGILAGYTFHLNDGGLFLSTEVDLVYHGGKARGRLEWSKDPEARENSGRDPDWPESGENWPDDWTFEKKHSYGVTLRLGGQPNFLGTALGIDAVLYVLAGIRRTEAEYSNSYEGCLLNSGCPDGREDGSYAKGTDWTERDYTAWTVGIGLHAPVADQASLQIETYYTDHDRETLVLLDNTNEPYIRVPHVLDAEELGLRLRLLRHF